jgi:hypothetical protein
VQKEVANRFFGDVVLRDQGLHSRVLIASPVTIAGTRFYREVTPEDQAAIDLYSEKIEAILAAPLSLVHGRPNELQLRVLQFTNAVSCMDSGTSQQRQRSMLRALRAC